MGCLWPLAQKWWKVVKMGFEWPLCHPSCHWGHGAGGDIAWAPANSKLGKFSKFGEFVDFSKFSFPTKRWAKITKTSLFSQLGGPGGLGGGTTAHWPGAAF